MTIESVMPSSHLILCCCLLLLPPIPPSIRVFSNESTLTWGGQSTGVSALASFLPKKSQGWCPSEWTGWISLQSNHFMANRWGNIGNSGRLYFFWSPKSLQMVTAAMELKDAWSLQEKLSPTRQPIKKKQRHYFANKDSSSQGSGFSCGHVWMWELDCEEG